MALRPHLTSTFSISAHGFISGEGVRGTQLCIASVGRSWVEIQFGIAASTGAVTKVAIATAAGSAESGHRGRT